MPAIVDKENDEFVVVHSNPEWSNGTPTHNTLVTTLIAAQLARLADPLCCADVHQQVLCMTDSICPMAHNINTSYERRTWYFRSPETPESRWKHARSALIPRDVQKNFSVL